MSCDARRTSAATDKTEDEEREIERGDERLKKKRKNKPNSQLTSPDASESESDVFFVYVTIPLAMFFQD